MQIPCSHLKRLKSPSFSTSSRASGGPGLVLKPESDIQSTTRCPEAPDLHFEKHG